MWLGSSRSGSECPRIRDPSTAHSPGAGKKNGDSTPEALMFERLSTIDWERAYENLRREALAVRGVTAWGCSYREG
jgi:hypothetical protein